ncbi:MAG TPA: CAP domain-containing protein [Actinomycetota bacterium]|nr:CAP domain-containing protein [Actinomycetota bacterium]
MRRLARYSIALILATAVSIAGVQVVQAASGEENGFVSRINSERSKRGIHTLVWAEDLAQVARRHSQRMASQKNLHHNPNLRSEVDGWEVVGENVGYGPGVEDLHQAFMDSQSHRANILDRSYTQVGVGTVWRDGLLWVTQVFRKPVSSSNTSNGSGPSASGSSSAPRKASKPKAAAKPKPAAPRPVPAAPAAPIHPPSTPAAELTRRMIETLLGGQEPVSGSVEAADFSLEPASVGSGSAGMSLRSFAELAGRVNRRLLEQAAGR